MLLLESLAFHVFSCKKDMLVAWGCTTVALQQDFLRPDSMRPTVWGAQTRGSLQSKR